MKKNVSIIIPTFNEKDKINHYLKIIDEIENQVRILAEAKECLTLLESVMKPPAE